MVMPREFRAHPVYLLPEASALALAGTLSYIIHKSGAQLQTITIFPETPGGATLNTLSFVLVMAGTATLTYLMVKYRLRSMIKWMIKAAFILVVFLLINWYGGVYTRFLSADEAALNNLILVVAVVLTGFLTYATHFRVGFWHVAAVILVGAMIGTFLGASIPLLTSVVLLVGLGVYDTLAVYKGPIGMIAKKAEIDDFTGAVFTFKDLTTGLGDVVFYSMLASAAMLNFGPVPFLTACVGIVVGTYAVYKLLETREMFPGLPISLGLGLILMFLAVEASKFVRIA